MPDTPEIRDAATPADLDAVRALFREYVGAPGWEAGFAEYLARQEFDRELETLPGAYAPPRGALLLAAAGAEPAGCVALKPLAPDGVCELKRLYVRPAFRGRGLGAALVERVLAAARAAGYARVRLDTLPSMPSARRLYGAFGFREIPPYCDNPVPGAVFLELELQLPPATPHPRPRR